MSETKSFYEDIFLKDCVDFEVGALDIQTVREVAVICVCVYVSVIILFYTGDNVWRNRKNLCTGFSNTHTNIKTHIHINTHTHVHISTYTHIHTCTHTYAHSHKYTDTYTHSYTHTNIQIHTHIYTHKHTHNTNADI